jgi:hypothetical protein
LREERRLRRIYGSKRDEVTEEWRKLHNEELKDLADTFKCDNEPSDCRKCGEFLD